MVLVFLNLVHPNMSPVRNKHIMFVRISCFDFVFNLHLILKLWEVIGKYTIHGAFGRILEDFLPCADHKISQAPNICHRLCKCTGRLTSLTSLAAVVREQEKRKLEAACPWVEMR